jgi:hypothetical protein
MLCPTAVCSLALRRACNRRRCRCLRWDLNWITTWSTVSPDHPVRDHLHSRQSRLIRRRLGCQFQHRDWRAIGKHCVVRCLAIDYAALRKIDGFDFIDCSTI